MEYLDVMVLGAGHSIMLTNFNDPTGKFVENYGQNFKAGNMTDFGLFAEAGSTEVSEDGYIEPVFRMLSEVIVAKRYNPTDFSSPGVLKKSMDLLKGQTVYTNHNNLVGNEVGAVKETFWQESFEQDGVVVPAGINAQLKIDAKSNEKLARGITMDPPSIHSNSVSVQFAWEPSHKFKDLWEFYEKLGTYCEKGELIRRVVTRIVNYSETSLVSHGADPFAQRILEGGKLNHIAHAATSYYGVMKNSLSGGQEELKEVIKRNIYFGDFKALDSIENGLITPRLNHNTSGSNNKGDNTKSEKNMKKEGQEQKTPVDISSLFGEGLLNLAEGQASSLETAQIQIRSLISENEKLNKTIKENQAMLGVADKYVKDLRETTLETFKKLSGGEEKADTNILQLIGSTDVNILESLHKSYKAQLEEKFQLKCSKCGSHDVSRASSLSEEDEGGKEKEKEAQTPSTSGNVMDELYQSKLHKK